MKTLLPGIVLLSFAIAFTAKAQDYNDEPLNDNWAPSEWGPDDKAGAVNRTTPQMVLKAVELVQQGKVATLGKVYASDIPLFGERAYKLTDSRLASRRSGGPAMACR